MRQSTRIQEQAEKITQFEDPNRVAAQQVVDGAL